MKLGKMLALALLVCTGCLSTPPADNPSILRPAINEVENPILIRPGKPTDAAYAEVFESVLHVLDDYFVIAYANRYDGRIISQPKIAPGLERFWAFGSNDPYERFLATCQTMRYRCFVQIRAAEQRGYLVQTTVYRELLDQPRPFTAPSGSLFRDQATVDRQFVVVDPKFPEEDRWIPQGRATEIEDAILKRIRRCEFKMQEALPPP
jgi:hypothetical protein